MKYRRASAKDGIRLNWTLWSSYQIISMPYSRYQKMMKIIPLGGDVGINYGERG